MLGFTMVIDQSESRTQACHVRIAYLSCSAYTVLLFHSVKMLLDGKVAVVYSGARGIGKAYCDLLLQKGCKVKH